MVSNNTPITAIADAGIAAILADPTSATAIDLNSTYAPITPAESYSYIPGIVADSGVTNNYAPITAYLATLTHGGQNNLVLPPGAVGVSPSIVPPAGVILNGSGYSNDYGSGTMLCPLQTGNTFVSHHGVVDLSNNNSGVNNLNINGSNPVTYVAADFALNIAGIGNTFTCCGLYHGDLASLHTATTTHTTIGTTWFADQGPSSNSLTVWLEGPDAEYSNFVVGGPTKITAGANQFDAFHLISGPDGIETLPLLYELGGNIFTNGYFDSVLTGANAMIDRSAATAPSRYAAGLWFQAATTAVTGIPIFLEATAAGAGADIDGFVTYPFGGGASTFTYFIQNPIVSTQVRVNVPSGALTSGMANNSLGSVVNTRAPVAADPNALTVGEATLRRSEVSATGLNMDGAGKMDLTYFTAQKTETATYVRTMSGSAGAVGATLTRIGLYLIASNGDGTLVASTPSDTTMFAPAWTSFTKAFSVPYAKVAGQRYAIGFLLVGASTMPKLLGVSSLIGDETILAPTVASRLDGQTNLPATFSHSDIAQSSIQFYAVVTP